MPISETSAVSIASILAVQNQRWRSSQAASASLVLMTSARRKCRRVGLQFRGHLQGSLLHVEPEPFSLSPCKLEFGFFIHAIQVTGNT